MSTFLVSVCVRLYDKRADIGEFCKKPRLHPMLTFVFNWLSTKCAHGNYSMVKVRERKYKKYRKKTIIEVL